MIIHYAYFKTTPLASSQSIIFKLLLITYIAFNGLAPAYIKELIKVIPLKLLYHQTFFETWHNQHS